MSESVLARVRNHARCKVQNDLGRALGSEESECARVPNRSVSSDSDQESAYKRGHDRRRKDRQNCIASGWSVFVPGSNPVEPMQIATLF